MLRTRTRDNDTTFSVVVDGADVPLFRITQHHEGLLLSVRQDRRWEPTPERGSTEHLAQMLTGPLRFLWFIDAEDAAADAVANL
jgi:hypothetical protein